MFSLQNSIVTPKKIIHLDNTCLLTVVDKNRNIAKFVQQLSIPIISLKKLHINNNNIYINFIILVEKLES